MRLATILTAAVLSSGLACNIQPAHINPPYEPRLREERIEWRSSIGIQAAHQFVFNDCIAIEDLEEELRDYGSPYNLSARDVAESIAWGLYHHRHELPSSEEDRLRNYIYEKIDIYGERFLTITDILYSQGDYNRTIPVFLYEPIRTVITADSPEQLKSQVGFGLRIAHLFNGNLEKEYQELRNYWNETIVERR